MLILLGEVWLFYQIFWWVSNRRKVIKQWPKMLKCHNFILFNLTFIVYFRARSVQHSTVWVSQRRHLYTWRLGMWWWTWLPWQQWRAQLFSRYQSKFEWCHLQIFLSLSKQSMRDPNSKYGTVRSILLSFLRPFCEIVEKTFQDDEWRSHDDLILGFLNDMGSDTVCFLHSNLDFVALRLGTWQLWPLLRQIVNSPIIITTAVIWHNIIFHMQQ